MNRFGMMRGLLLLMPLFAPNDGGGGGGGGDGGDKGGGGDGGDKGGGGSKTNNVPPGDPGWYGQFNDDSRSALREAGIKEPNELVSTFKTLRSEMGKDRIVVPGADATPEQRQAFLKAIGAGEKAEAYRWDDVDVTGVNPGFLGAVQAGMHKHGLPLDAAKGFMADVLAFTKEQRAKDLDESTATLNQERQQLDATWGANATTNHALAHRAGEALGLSKDDIAAMGGAAGYGKVMTALFKAGSILREAKNLPGANNLPNMETDSVDSAKAWLAKAKSDKSIGAKLAAGDKALLAEHTRMTKIVADAQ